MSSTSSLFWGPPLAALPARRRQVTGGAPRSRAVQAPENAYGGCESYTPRRRPISTRNFSQHARPRQVRRRQGETLVPYLQDVGQNRRRSPFLAAACGFACFGALGRLPPGEDTSARAGVGQRDDRRLLSREAPPCNPAPASDASMDASRGAVLDWRRSRASGSGCPKRARGAALADRGSPPSLREAAEAESAHRNGKHARVRSRPHTFLLRTA